MGDRFVLRETGRRMVVGGGRVLDPSPPSTFAKRRTVGRRLAPLAGASRGEQADGLLAVRGRAQLAELAAHTRGGAPGRCVTAGGVAVSEESAESLIVRLKSLVGDYHQKHPFQLGIPAARAASELEIEQAILVELTRSHPRLQLEGTVIKDPGAQSDLDPTEAPEWVEARGRLSAGGLLTPSPADLGLEEDLVHALGRIGALIRVTPSICYLPGQVQDLLGIAAGLDQPFTVSAFRAAAGLSRKYAVPFLEWTDSQGETHRRGSLRFVVE